MDSCVMIVIDGSLRMHVHIGLFMFLGSNLALRSL